VATISLSFAPPRHGWLPVRVAAGDEIVEFVASNVPNNPAQCLADAISTSFHGFTTEVWWNLEPEGYYFGFSPHPDGVKFCVSFAECAQGLNRCELLSVVGTTTEILLPVWRALRQLESLKIGEPHWSNTEFAELASLGKVLHAQSAG
jgi:hypothetical protein